MVQNVTDSEFHVQVEDAKGLVLVDFWAGWCGPCKMMAPVYEAMSAKYASIKFCKVDTDANPESSIKYGITGIPCIVVFRDGKEVDRLIGYMTEKQFDSELIRLTK